MSPVVHYRIKRGDTVEVLAGKDRGKRSRVRQVLPKEGRAIVENVNVAKRHLKVGVRGARQAGIVEVEMPIHISNLALVCPRCNKAVRTGYRFLEDGTKVRYCKSCGEQV